MNAASHSVYGVYKRGTPLNSLVRHAIRLFPSRGYTDKRSVNALRRGWIGAVSSLGERWILHPVHRVKFVRGGHL
jgi:hypothetical protein